tara:strand:- start:1002 stop:1238 length:237 start_codon:yes stop_codon:yes gene_type:complete
MGRAIDNENRLDDHDREIKLIKDNHGRRIKLLEDALEEMIQTRVHHVDLTEDRKLKSDEEYTVPVGKRKKTTKTPATT